MKLWAIIRSNVLGYAVLEHRVRQGLGQLIFVAAQARRVTLRAAPLAEQPADSAFRDRIRHTHVAHWATPPFGAYKFPRATYYRWRKEYGGLKLEQAKRLKELEKENSRLKRLVAELSLDKQILQDVLRNEAAEPDLAIRGFSAPLFHFSLMRHDRPLPFFGRLDLFIFLVAGAGSWTIDEGRRGATPLYFREGNGRHERVAV